MRQLWATGWMHNRVRMIAASFLVKHLLIDWRAGERWFWDTLVDADYASNGVNWQWVAGTGIDANMFVRIMAPLTQSPKFDAAAYIRQWVPELAGLSDAEIHDPPEDRAALQAIRARSSSTRPRANGRWRFIASSSLPRGSAGCILQPVNREAARGGALLEGGRRFGIAPGFLGARVRRRFPFADRPD